MWVFLAFLSSFFLGVYQAFKKQALRNNAVIPVLFLTTLFTCLIFLPFVLLSAGTNLLDDTILYVPSADWQTHGYILLKSAIALVSWIFGFFGMKHLPITIVGPVNASRPIMVLVGAMIVFGERLNFYQWIGVLLAIISFFMLSRSGKREGINFSRNKFVYYIVLAAVAGAVSGLYDKFLMDRFDRMLVQSWNNIYQSIIMFVILIIVRRPSRKNLPLFKWRWSILGISIFLSAADFIYFHSLTFDDSMVSIVSMIRRSSIIVSFICGALIFHEKNLRRKAVDMVLMLIGLIFLYIGSR